MELVHLAILLALVEYIVFIGVVGTARGKFGVEAPAVVGNPDFERLYRVQQNTLEQLMLFIPGILGFAHYVDPTWAAGIGAVYLIGRILYFFGYRTAAEKRAIGASLSIFPNIALVIGALIGLIIGSF